MRVRLRRTESCLFARARESKGIKDIRTGVVSFVAMYRSSSSSDEGPLWYESPIEQRHVSHGEAGKRNFGEM